MQWQIGEAHYNEFLDYLAAKYDIDRKVRTPATNRLEDFFRAQTHAELIPMMMREFLSNTKGDSQSPAKKDMENTKDADAVGIESTALFGSNVGMVGRGEILSYLRQKISRRNVLSRWFQEARSKGRGENNGDYCLAERRA